jgi:hypothetical protein
LRDAGFVVSGAWFFFLWAMATLSVAHALPKYCPKKILKSRGAFDL